MTAMDAETQEALRNFTGLVEMIPVGAGGYAEDVHVASPLQLGAAYEAARFNADMQGGPNIDMSTMLGSDQIDLSGLNGPAEPNTGPVIRGPNYRTPGLN